MSFKVNNLIKKTICTYLVINRMGVTKNKEDANVRRWKRKIVSMMDPDATVRAPSVRRTILVTSKSRDRPELPLKPALTFCTTIIRQAPSTMVIKAQIVSLKCLLLCGMNL